MNDWPRFRIPVSALVVSAVLAPTYAHAYIDPGSAGFVITTVLGAIAAAGYVIRGWLGTAKNWLRRVGRRGDSGEHPSDKPTAEAGPSASNTDESTSTKP